MPSINRVQIIGNITADTEVKATKGGKKCAPFTIATNEQWKNKQGDIMRTASFHKAIAWNGLADFAGRICNKGRLVYVEGKLVNREYENAAKEKRHITEILVTSLKPLGYGKKEEDTKPEELPMEDVEVEVVQEEVVA